MGPYKAKYGTRLPLYYYNDDEEIPQIVVDIPSGQAINIQFVLAPESIVRLDGWHPFPDYLLRRPNSWGNLQKILRIRKSEQLRLGRDTLQFDVMIERPVWIATCPEQISACISSLMDNVAELREKITQRNRLIKDLREKIKNLRKC